MSAQLLPGVTQIGWALASGEIATPGIDVQAAAPRIAGIDCQFLRLALAQDVHENALDALLVELIVVAKPNQVLQQTLLINLRANVADLQAGPIRLARYQAI